MNKILKKTLSTAAWLISIIVVIVILFTFVWPSTIVFYKENYVAEKTDIYFNEELTNKQVFLIDKVFDTYEKHSDKNKIINIVPTFKLTFDDYCAVDSFVSIWCGDISLSNKIITPMIYGQRIVALRVDTSVMRKGINTRQVITSELDNMVSTLKGKNNYEKLYNFSVWLSENIKYDEGFSSAQDVVLRKIGSCNAVSLTFKMMAEKLGIGSDICFNFNPDINHAWNRVLQQDGKYRYYDIVGYQGLKDKGLLNSKLSRYDVETINTYKYLLNK